MDKWARAKYCPNLPVGTDGQYVTSSKEHKELSKYAAKCGMVLLENVNNTLPLKEGTRVALVGKGTFDYVRGGGGSGDVYCEYSKNIYDGLKELGKTSIFEPLCDYYRDAVNAQYEKHIAPGMTEEPAVPEELLKEAAAYADTAIVTFSRFSGEGWDRSEVSFYEDEVNPWIIGQDDGENFENLVTPMNELSARIFPKRDFYLTDAEEEMLAKTRKAFKTVIVLLNVGGMMDLSFLRKQSVDAALFMWAPGMEGGSAAAELLLGMDNPSGKLPDTFADSLDAYPSTARFHESGRYAPYDEDIYVGYRYFETVPGAKEHVVYPFGYGLSYTSFEITCDEIKVSEKEVSVLFAVCNTGDVPGREVVQLYVEAPQGKLGKAKLSLIGFAKTELLMPRERKHIELIVPTSSFASYDDLGKVAKNAYVLEAGEYRFHLGNSAEHVALLPATLQLAKDTVVEQLSCKLAPTSLSERLLADGSMEKLPTSEPLDPDEDAIGRVAKGADAGYTPFIRSREQHLINRPYRDGVTLPKEMGGKATLDEFLSDLTDDELIHLLGGQPNTGMANTFGMGNLPEVGLPSFMTADGPAGLRLGEYCGVHATCWPCASLLASSWDEELMNRVGAAAGAEVKECNIFMWLAPAVNIHRNPMCGRNFEYLSEDPLLAGKLAAAEVRGIQSNKVAATIKHFACNNKETNRIYCDALVSERALREIYLKVFEIIVKEADPWCVMSSYNLINGRRCSESKELLTDILRDEWGFGGMVMTDWWNRGEHYKEVLAGNDVKMPTGFPDRLVKAMEIGVLHREDLERSAKRLLELLFKFE